MDTVMPTNWLWVSGEATETVVAATRHRMRSAIASAVARAR
jgi:hypothetical protein